ncbi:MULTISPECIES: glycoside hydrolase family 27 protein [unclassified Caulobacter]|uniref:glycoside hydrolase family 27 protein n=1 Tax=unclassified Caulobacter TaxID=2648921 RepID=UPI0006F8DBB4|nr:MULTISPECIES: glycoside hydrolase family 27 protein [unclassified Caulobacter]KQV62200.1 alpha-galactosidase [Caulobacter sp. Root342]KQV63120.1 alpha-galactosidase [Caulobacter sp. Root343]
MSKSPERLVALLAALALALGVPAGALAADKDPPPRVPNGLAQTPPMGWNSWNKFACNIDEATVRRVADAMASNGMKEAGYQYVVIDDCWHGPRDAGGFITYDAKRFPSGIKALSDYVHAKGLKFGIYSDAGRQTCGGRPGSQGHEFQDAKTYADWGVDYLKYDWCATGTRNAEEAYTLMADALRETGRDIVFSMCEWGTAKPWLWASKVGNVWRTTGDITDKWDGKHDYALGILPILDANEPLHPFAGPGHWNDPDMLEVGNGGLTTTEYRAHFSLWSLMAAPLIAGNDVANMDQATRDILLNKEVIAINQDKLGVQGRRVRDDGDLEVWSKPLADGGRAVILFNRGAEAKSIAVDWTELGYPAGLRARVRDLWAGKDLGPMKERFAATAPSHGVVMVTVRP